MTTSAAPQPYDIESATPGFRDYLQRYTAASAKTRAQREARLDLAYGPGPGETLDVFLPERARAPIVIYLHGGGWRGSSKNDRAFPAEVFCPAGAIWISQEYPLAPAASLDEMVDAVCRGIAWVARHAADFGGDPDRIFVCGNSAGGHLAAMALCADWSKRGVPGGVVKGATTISGVFNMVPLIAGTQAWLKLDIASAVRNSPILNLPAHGCPLICAVGADEPPEFVEQSEAFAAAWVNRSFPATFLRCAGLHHFSIIGELGNRESALVRAMFWQIGGLDAP